MPSDEELKSFIDNAQDNQRLALCLVSRKLRVIKRENFDFRGILRENADIVYLKDNLNYNQDVKQIVEYLNTNPPIPNIEHVDGLWGNKDFKNQDEMYNNLKAAAAAAAAPPPPAAAVAPPPPAPAAAGTGAGGGGIAAAAALSTPAAPPPPLRPATDESWLMRGASVVDQGVGAVVGGVVGAPIAVHNAVDRIVVGRPQEALPTLVDVISIGAEAGAREGLRLEAFSAGWNAGAAAADAPPPAAGARGPVDGGQGDGGGGGGQGDGADAAKDATHTNPADDEEERRKLLVSLQTANPEARLEVFCDDEKKKKQYDATLEKFLVDEPTYKKNKDSPFFYFLSISDKTRADNIPLPHVTKTDFNKILKKDSFAITASQYAVACKMELGKDEKIVIGNDELSNQCFIDVQDYLNHTRIFLSKDNFTKLEQYKENLVQEFKELLENDNANFKEAGVDFIKKEIEEKIFKFGSIKDVKSAKGVAPVPAVPPNTSNNSLASKVGLSPEKIDEYAQKLADQFWQRKLMKGDLSVEAKNTSSGDYDEAQRLGHIKIERPKTDKDRRIKVYKFGSDGDINLTHVNLGIGDQIMQIEVKNITKDGVTGVEYFKQNPSEINNFNLRVYNQKDLNETVKKAKVDVFVEDSTKKEMRRFKIRGGADNSKPITTKANKIVTPLSAEAPKIFTIEKGQKSVGIGDGTAWALGFMPFPGIKGDSQIDIKKKGDGYELRFGKNKLKGTGLGRLSNSRGGYINNPIFKEIEGVEEEFKLAKKGGILGRRWFSSKGTKLHKVGDTESIKILVENEDEGKIVELEISQGGTLNTNPFKTARNAYNLKVVSERSTVPPTTFQPQNVLSPAPLTGPAGQAQPRP